MVANALQAKYMQIDKHQGKVGQACTVAKLLHKIINNYTPTLIWNVYIDIVLPYKLLLIKLFCPVGFTLHEYTLSNYDFVIHCCLSLWTIVPNHCSVIRLCSTNKNIIIYFQGL